VPTKPDPHVTPPAEEQPEPPVFGAPAPRGRIKELIAEWTPRLKALLAAWQGTLPPEATTEWRTGAAYVRESSARSLVGDAPDVQLRSVLGMLASKEVYVPPDGLFFDVHTGTEIGARMAFRQMYDRAINGGFQAVGVSVNERLMRNVVESAGVRRAFRMRAIELVYQGQYEGDPRNPAKWQLETMQDQNAEAHARNTSYYVGTRCEIVSRQGRPVGKIPEVYQVAERGPSYLGRQGPAQSWTLVEPLASIIKEGCRRYLAGASLTDLERWADTTELGGRTPRGRPMNSQWWHNTLRNPRFAGYQMPTEYTGFRPGKDSPPRRRWRADAELVPCLLPALWTLEEYQTILATFRKRSHGPKPRHTYRQYLLSGVGVDASCGHRLRVVMYGRNGHYWMGCLEGGWNSKHSPSFRCDVAAAELDVLIGRLSFEDAAFQQQVEAELRALSAAQSEASQRFRADPAIAKVRQALDLLAGAGIDTHRHQLEQEIAALEAADAARRDSLHQPLVDFRKALAHLRNWKEVWADADTALKNRLLRDVGLRVEVGRFPGEKAPKPGHVLAIQAANPAFQLALATAWRDLSTLEKQDVHNAPNVEIRFHGKSDVAVIMRAAGLLAQNADSIRLARPTLPMAQAEQPKIVDPEPDGLITINEFARRASVGPTVVRQWIHAGTLDVVFVRRRGRPARALRESDIPLAIALREEKARLRARPPLRSITHDQRVRKAA
jgi:hypothetical protein